MENKEKCNPHSVDVIQRSRCKKPRNTKTSKQPADLVPLAPRLNQVEADTRDDAAAANTMPEGCPAGIAHGCPNFRDDSAACEQCIHEHSMDPKQRDACYPFAFNEIIDYMCKKVHPAGGFAPYEKKKGMGAQTSGPATAPAKALATQGEVAIATQSEVVDAVDEWGNPSRPETVTHSHEAIADGHTTVTNAHEIMTDNDQATADDHHTLADNHQATSDDHEPVSGVMADGHETLAEKHRIMAADVDRKVEALRVMGEGYAHTANVIEAKMEARRMKVAMAALVTNTAEHDSVPDTEEAEQGPDAHETVADMMEAKKKASPDVADADIPDHLSMMRKGKQTPDKPDSGVTTRDRVQFGVYEPESLLDGVTPLEPCHGLKECQTVEQNAEKAFLAGDLDTSTRLLRNAIGDPDPTLGPEHEGRKPPAWFKYLWPRALVRYHSANLMRQVRNNAITLNPWPTNTEREDAGRRFLHEDLELSADWFETYEGQRTALEALPAMRGSGTYDYVADIDDVDAFVAKYRRYNRPVVVGARGAAVLLKEFFADPKMRTAWEKDALASSFTQVNVGSVAYSAVFGGGEQDVFGSEETQAAVVPDDAAIEQCGTDPTEGTCKVALKALWKNRWTNQPMPLSRLVADVLTKDTFRHAHAPDLRYTFGASNPETAKLFGFDLNHLPAFMNDTFKSEGETDCRECPGCWCRFQFTLGPALAGSQPHDHRGAWNFLLRGRKRWFVFPPSVSQDIWMPGYTGYERNPAYEWATTDLPKVHENGFSPMEFEQYSGEIVFVPADHGHAVVNYEPSLGFAIEINHHQDE